MSPMDRLWAWGTEQFIAVGGPDWHDKMMLGLGAVIVAVTICGGAGLLLFLWGRRP